MDLLEMDAIQLSAAMRGGALGVGEAVAFYQGQIAKKEPQIGAFLTVTEEGLRERIAEVQEGIRSGRYAGKLAGVPVALKDNICKTKLRTTCASKILEHFVPVYDATVVERLEAAGMIVMGKTNMDEFAMGNTTETSAFQITKNPWNTAHVPGGSSGGSCAAVAAGEVPLALGSDTGGSIRQPAAYCGVVGLKPTYGRVSRYGLVAYASSMDQIGPVGKNVAECKILYGLLAGADRKDATTVKLAAEKEETEDLADWESRLYRMRFALPREYLGTGTEPEVRVAVKAAADLLEKYGAVVEEISFPMAEYAVALYYIIACAEASSNLARYDGVKYGFRAKKEEKLHEMYKKSRTEGFGEEVKRRLLLGSFVLSEGYYDAYYQRALKGRRLLREAFAKVFSSYDCILTPTTPMVAPKLCSGGGEPLKRYLEDTTTVAVNLTGLPAISVPCGFGRDGLPIGLQMIGNSFCEETLFTAAGAYEALRGSRETPQRGKNETGQKEGRGMLDGKQGE